MGVLAWLALARLANASAFLFGLTTHDPFVFVGASALVLVVAVSAVARPASRALRLDPLRALAADAFS
jgi:putative ABC transport system permease protein